MENIKKRKIIFLDRDGTICTDRGAFQKKIIDYQEVLDNIEPLENTKESLKRLKDAGFLLVVISNQAGVSKGKFKESDIHKFNKTLNEKLDNMLDGFYYCIHHDTGKEQDGSYYSGLVKELIIECGCRKPKIGMFLKCKEDLKKGYIQYIDEEILNSDYIYKKDRQIYKKNIEPCEIDIENSYMIGDKYQDVVAGKNFDLKSIFVLTGEGKKERERYSATMKKDRDYDFIAKDILDAANYILEKGKV